MFIFLSRFTTGVLLVRKRAFSLYDVEQFIREAGAEKVNEKAVISLEQELEDSAKHLINEACTYANYAGRTKLIKSSDIRLANGPGMKKIRLVYIGAKKSARKKIHLVKISKRESITARQAP